MSRRTLCGVGTPVLRQAALNAALAAGVYRSLRASLAT